MSKYTTGEIAKLCGVSVRTVQYYDTRNILTPSELTEGGRRLYSEEDLKRMKIICFLRAAGISINSIGELLSEHDPSSVISVLLEQQENILKEEMHERQAKLEMLNGIKQELKTIENFSIESIGDIAYASDQFSISCLARRNKMNVLTIQNLIKSFGSKKVLCGLELSVQEHSIFGFIGKNGAGKTTTMKAILGLTKCDSGAIYVMGEKVHFGLTNTNRYIGYLPDVPEFYSYMTATEYLTLCGNLCGMDKADIVARSTELLKLVGLGQEKQRIKGFSRGMKQRLGIAQALLNRPKLLICDEPTSALDPAGRKEILDILLAAKEQTTILFSTHILSDVERICTEVAFLNNGKITMQGTIAELRNKQSCGGFITEIEKKEVASMLAEAFNELQHAEENALIFQGDDNRFFDMMQYISENRIPIQKIERLEPTPETLFLEVTK